MQITEEKKEDIIEQAKEFKKVLGERLIVKACITKETLAAMPILQKQGYKVNITGVVSLPQTIYAIQAGADFVSVYVGRANDSGVDGINIIQKAREFIDQNSYKTELIAASIRSVRSYVDSANAGADWSAPPYEILPKLINHPTTDSSIKGFNKDWNSIPKS